MPLELSEVTRPGVRSLLLVAGLLKELKIANARPVTEAIQLPLVQGDVNWQTTLVMEEVHMNVTTFLAREPVHEIPAASPPNLSFFQAAESAAAALGGAAICAAHRTSLSSFFASFSEFCKMDGLDSATGKLCGGEFAEKPSEGKEEKTESCNVEELDNISEELASEVSRERQHLMLMQEQVDKQAHSLQKEVGEIHKTLEQEKTQRTLVQQKYRDDNENLGESLKSISKELEELRHLVHNMKTPWMLKMFDNVCGVFKQCSMEGMRYSSLSST